MLTAIPGKKLNIRRVIREENRLFFRAGGGRHPHLAADRKNHPGFFFKRTRFRKRNPDDFFCLRPDADDARLLL